MIRSTLMATVAISPLLLTPAVAQQSFDLGTIALSSSLSPVELGRTGTTVEVLEGADAGGNDTSVINRLDRLPGVGSTSNGGLGAQTGIAIRGLPTRYVGVRINGIDVTDPSTTQTSFNFGGLISAGLDRVEVLKGSQSALYGSEAIAGVVDISTFRPTELGYSGQAAVEAGSFDTQKASFGVGFKSERGDIALSWSRIVSDGISAQASNDEEDGFAQTFVTLSGAYDVSDAVTLGASVLYRDSRAEFDAFGELLAESHRREVGARVFADVQTGAVTHTFSYSSFDIDRDTGGGAITTIEGKRREIAYLGSADLGQGYTLTFGAERTDEDLNSNTTIASEDTTTIKAELLAELAGNLDVSAALRYDDNSSFGGETTGRLAAVWRPRDDLAFRALVGTGFRTPSLFELFSSFGDPGLQPETSVSFELGVEKTYANGFVKATLFRTDIDDLIDFDGGATACGSGFGCYNQVAGTTTSQGFELSGSYDLNNRFTLYGGYTYTDAETDGVRLSRTPRHDVVVGLDAALTNRLSATLDIRHVADVVPLAFAPADNLVGDYTIVGIGAAYEVNDTAEVYLRVENLFDEEYETAGGFNQPGRGVFLGVRTNF